MPGTADKLDRYMRELIALWLSDTGTSAAELARRAGFTETAISDVRSEKRGVGRDVWIKVAKAMGYSLDAIVAESDRWDGVGPIVAPSPSFIAYDERYPRFPLGAGVARTKGASEEAIARARTMALKSSEDPTIERWVELILVEQRIIERDAQEPPAKREARRQAASRLDAETRAAVDAGETAEQGAFRPGAKKKPPTR